MSNNSSATAEKATAPGGLQGVERALDVLELLARWGEGGVSELAVELDVHKSTIFRVLGALESRGLVDQTEDRGKYRLDWGLVRLAGAVSARMDITSPARPVVARLSNDLGETVNIAVLIEHCAVNVDQALGPASISAMNWVGRQTPLHATSSGKVLLANVAPVPVRDARGMVVAALSASGPSYRLTADRMKERAPHEGCGRADQPPARLRRQLSHQNDTDLRSTGMPHPHEEHSIGSVRINEVHSVRLWFSVSRRIIGVKMSCIASSIFPPGTTIVFGRDM